MSDTPSIITTGNFMPESVENHPADHWAVTLGITRELVERIDRKLDRVDLKVEAIGGQLSELKAAQQILERRVEDNELWRKEVAPHVNQITPMVEDIQQILSREDARKAVWGRILMSMIGSLLTAGTGIAVYYLTHAH